MQIILASAKIMNDRSATKGDACQSKKVKSMKQMRQVMTKFQERNGATQCKLLKGVGTKVVLRECPDCVADAAEFLEEQINQPPQK